MSWPAGGRATIDLGALADNWRTVRGEVQAGETAAVVKALGYGLGLRQAASALAHAGCRTFFVATPSEGVELRERLRDVDVYVLNGLLPGAANVYASARLRPVLGSRPEIEEWAAAATGEPCAIHVDTGMHRLGLSPDETRQLAADGTLMRALAPTLVMSHLACADTPQHPLNARQRAAFQQLRTLFPDIPASLANSAGIFLGSDYHFDLVRPGIALYGAQFADGRPPLKPVVTVQVQVLQVRDTAAGETIGYGATYAFRTPSRVAILAAGYADGYPRSASASNTHPGARIWIGDRFAPIVGRVSMDLIAVDVTGIAGVKRGDWAELFGRNVPVDEVASHAGTIGYELLTSLGPRYERSYVGGA